MDLIVANDDGVEDYGIWILAQELQQIGRVALYSPERNCSGAGMSISLRKKFDLRSVSGPADVDVDIPAFAVEAPPATVVALGALHAYDGQADAVVAGINSGWNPGIEAYKVSGTVGAARVAVERGILGIAISAATELQPFNQHVDGMKAYRAIASATRRMLDAVQDVFNPLPNVLVNVNVPANYSAETPVRLTRPGPFTLFSGLVMCDRCDGDDAATVRIEYGDYFSAGATSENEIGALANGSVAISVTGAAPAEVLLHDPWPSIAEAFRP